MRNNFIISRYMSMGMNAVNYVIVGARIPREKYQEEFGHPYQMDDRDNDLVAIGGFEKQWESIVVGEIKEKMDPQGGVIAQPPTDLISEYSSAKNEVREKLEEIGIDDREISIYLVGAFL